MATQINRYQSMITPTPAINRVQEQQQKLVDNSGKAMTAMGEVVGQYGEGLQKQALTREEANQKLWLTSRAASDTLKAQELLDQQMRTAGDGSSISESLTKEWQNHVAKQTSTLDANPYLKNAYAMQLASIGEKIGLSAKTFDNAQADRFSTKAAEEAYNSAAKTFDFLKDPMEISAQAEEALGRLSSDLDKTPMDAEKRAAIKEKMLTTIVNAANTRWINLDPDGYKVAHALGMSPEARAADKSLPRGLRNNNPGNIRPSSDTWQGQTGDDGGGYLQFSTPEAGLRAMAINLKNQKDKHGLTTVEGIITKYAPAADGNDTGSYIGVVAKALGVGPQDNIDIKDPETLKKFMIASIKHENSGQMPYSDKSLGWAVDAALLPNKAGDAPVSIGTVTTKDGEQVQGRVRTGSTIWNIGTYEQQKNWMELADKTIKARDAEAEKQQAITNARVASDMEIAAERGGLTYAQIEEAYSKNSITPAVRTSLTKKLDEINHNDAKSRVAMMRVDAAVKGEGVLDPKNTDDKKAVDIHFKDSLAQIQQTPDIQPEEMQTRIFSLVKNYGMVPESLQSQIRGQLRSGNVDQTVSGADMIAKLREINPQLLNDFADEDIKGANHVASLVQAGFSPKDAVFRATEAMKITPEIKAAREEAYKEAVKSSSSNTPEAQIKSKFNSYFANDPSVIPIEMQSDFDQLARAEYIRTGSLPAAQRTAVDFVGRTWGVTSIAFGADENSGKHWMKNPPEKYYGSGIKGVDESMWMKEQLAQELTENDKLSGVDYSKKQLMLTTSRELSKDGKPQYIVSYKDDNGLIQIYGGESGPLLWAPNWESSKERVRMLAGAKYDSLRGDEIIQAMQQGGKEGYIKRAWDEQKKGKK